MKNVILTIWMLSLIIFVNCSTQDKFNRLYKGKNETYVISKLGHPIQTENLADGNKLVVIEKKTILKAVPINTGQIRYDKFESPKSTKIETYHFRINKSGIVESVGYDCVYER